MTVKAFALFATAPGQRYIGLGGLIGFADTIEEAKNEFAKGFFPNHPNFGNPWCANDQDYGEEDWRGWQWGEIVETKSWVRVARLAGDYYTKSRTVLYRLNLET